MINQKYFLKAFKSIKGAGSPALVLGSSFIAIGALLRNLGLSIFHIFKKNYVIPVIFSLFFMTFFHDIF